MKKLTYFLLCSFIVLWGTIGHAELKTKWSFGTEATWVPRGLDLNTDGDNQIATRGDTSNTIGSNAGDGYSFFSTLLGADVEWIATQNTSVVADIRAQFDWHGSNSTVFPNQTSLPGQAGTYQNTGSTTALAFGFKQLFLGFKDFLDFPIDLSVGRQNIKLGRGFVVSRWSVGAGPTPYANGIGPSGSSLTAGAGQDGQTRAANAGNLPLNAVSASALYAPERNAFDAFDAVRAKVHFNKLHFDLGYALIAGAFSESANYVTTGGTAATSDRGIATRDSEYLLWFNGGYNWTKELLTEAYFVANFDEEPTSDRNTSSLGMDIFRDKVYTTGARADWVAGEFGMFKNVNPYIEAAVQLGQLGGDSFNANRRKRQAYATNLGADFTLSSSSKWVPSTWTFETFFFSGEQPGGLETDDRGATPSHAVAADNKWNSWDWQFTGVEYALIMPYLDIFHLTDTLGSDTQAGATLSAGKVDAGLTNRWVLRTKANFDLTKKWNLGLNLAYAQAVQPPSPGQSKVLGAEFDWGLGYKLSSATTALFDGGLFLPGTYYKRQPTNRTSAYMLRLGFKVDLG